MANIPFISGKPAYLQIKPSTSCIAAATGSIATINPMVIGGAGYSIGDNDILENLADAGAFGAAPANVITGLYTPVLHVSVRLHSWFTAANLWAMFGSSTADISARTNTNGNIPFIDVKWSNGYDVISDQMKLATMTIEGGASSNALLADLVFLGLNAASTATFGAFSATQGGAYRWKDVKKAAWIDQGAATEYDIAPTIQAFRIGISTGLTPGKVADGTDSPSYLDPAGILGTSFTLSQRSGAGSAYDSKNRLINSRIGLLKLAIGPSGAGGVQFDMGGDRMGRAIPFNLNGGLVDGITYQGLRVLGSGSAYNTFCDISVGS